MSDMLPQSQPLTVPIKGKFDAQPAVPPGATARHAGDTLWPWLLGLVLIGGLGFVIYKAVSKRQAPGLPAGSTPDAAMPAASAARTPSIVASTPTVVKPESIAGPIAGSGRPK